MATTSKLLKPLVDLGKNNIAPYFLNLAPWFGLLTILNNKNTKDFALTNAWVQTLIFILTAQLPSYVTGIMSWVDLAWPTGLVALGVQTFFNAGANTNPWRTGLGALLYLFQGGRMALGATSLVLNGHMQRDMPRYKYQFLRWEQSGIKKGTVWFTLMMQKEIFNQALANMGCLILPGVLVARNQLGRDAPLQSVEKIGLLLWIVSYCIEHTSDLQKGAFLRKMKAQGIRNASVTSGFWSLSRHPNYFGEYLVWVALSLFALPSLQSLLRVPEQDNVASEVGGGWWGSVVGSHANAVILQNVMLSLSLSLCSFSMYFCLTW